ncbi:MAG: rdgB [Nitrospirae bacterium]|nr:rdgB [Nitrospirota bacterium]
MELVLATRNRKKIEEILRITNGLKVKVLTLDDFPECPEVEEDGQTFEENAVKKAITVANFTGRPALADDSGLEVSALNGAPGTLSARYAGEPADDKKNIEKLLRVMHFIEKRDVKFVCCIAFAVPGSEVRIFYGYIEGSIGKEPRGSQGFGYDPVFYPMGSDRTFAEMHDEEKDALSHRGRALTAFKSFIQAWLPGENHEKKNC